jgi:ubiquinone/menaquinone biosynthesis C-methylase UbiE
MNPFANFETSERSSNTQLGISAVAGKEPIARAPDFDRLARIYRWMEWITFGSRLWYCRCVFMPDMQSRRKALVLGDGDGRFTAHLLSENPAILIDAVDASSAMLAELRRRAGTHAKRLRTCFADARTLTPDHENYDLVVTHFFLDCLTTYEIASLAEQLRSHLRPGAVWVISEFAVPDGWFGRVVARPVVSLLYRAFGLLTGLAVLRLPDHHAALTRSGFILRRQHRSLGGMLMSELWESDAYRAE